MTETNIKSIDTVLENVQLVNVKTISGICKQLSFPKKYNFCEFKNLVVTEFNINDKIDTIRIIEHGSQLTDETFEIRKYEFHKIQCIHLVYK